MSVLSELNRHLGLELGAHVRYNGHAEIIRYRGYSKLGDKYSEEAAEELSHANKVIRRIQQLGGIPNYQAFSPPAPVKKWDVAEILDSDTEAEKVVLDSLAVIIEQAENENDWETANVLRELVSDTEDHIQWLTSQVGQLHELGKANYLQAMI